MAQTHTEDGQARKQAEASGGPAGLTLGPEKTPSRNPPALGCCLPAGACTFVCVCTHTHTHTHTQRCLSYMVTFHTPIFL